MSDRLKIALPIAFAWMLAVGICSGVWVSASSYTEIREFMKVMYGDHERLRTLEKSYEVLKLRVDNLENRRANADAHVRHTLAGEMAVDMRKGEP